MLDTAIPAAVHDLIVAGLDLVDRWLNLGTLPRRVTVSWMHPPLPANYNACAFPTGTDVWLNANVLTESGGWEQSLVHEMCHIIDFQRLTDESRQAVMATLTRNGDYGAVLPATWGLDGSVPYADRAGECFAETLSRHLWYCLAQSLGPSADLGAWGTYTFDNSTAIPAMLKAIN